MVRIIRYNETYRGKTVKFIHGILEKEFGFYFKRPDLQAISETYQINKGDFWIAVEGKKIVGTIALRNCGKGRCYLKRMFVHKRYRGWASRKNCCGHL